MTQSISTVFFHCQLLNIISFIYAFPFKQKQVPIIYLTYIILSPIFFYSTVSRPLLSYNAVIPSILPNPCHNPVFFLVAAFPPPAFPPSFILSLSSFSLTPSAAPRPPWCTTRSPHWSSFRLLASSILLSQKMRRPAFVLSFRSTSSLRICLRQDPGPAARCDRCAKCSRVQRSCVQRSAVQRSCVQCSTGVS